MPLRVDEKLTAELIRQFASDLNEILERLHSVVEPLPSLTHFVAVFGVIQKIRVMLIIRKKLVPVFPPPIGKSRQRQNVGCLRFARDGVFLETQRVIPIIGPFKTFVE